MQDTLEAIKCFYEDQYTGYYIAFNGDAVTKDVVILELGKKDIRILKVGPSFRRAADGNQYEWYIKLARHISRDVFQEIMENASRNPLRELEAAKKSIDALEKELESESVFTIPPVDGWGEEPELDYPEVPMASGCEIKEPESDYPEVPNAEDVPDLEGDDRPDVEAEIRGSKRDDSVDRLALLISQLWKIADDYGAPQDDSVTRMSWINAQFQDWHNEIDSLKRQTDEIRNENTAHKMQSEFSKREIDGLKNSLETRESENKLLRNQLVALEKEWVSKGETTDATVRSRLEKENSDLKSSLMKLQGDYSCMKELAESAENENANRNKKLNREIEKLSLENIALQKRIQGSAMPAAMIAKPVSGSRSRTIEIIQRALETFLPRFVFHDSTYGTIVDQFNDYSKLFNALYALHGWEKKTGKKSIKNADGWCEMDDHINTGRDNRGRIYCRRRDNKGNHDVYIHYKRDDVEQERLFVKLGGMTLFQKE